MKDKKLYLLNLHSKTYRTKYNTIILEFQLEVLSTLRNVFVCSDLCFHIIDSTMVHAPQ